jgi:Pyridoxamine 5''-phosphate oxidase.
VTAENSVFTEKEIDYLNSQRLGRLSTIKPDGAPTNVPVGFRYNAESQTIDIGGHRLGDSFKFRNIQRDPRVAFVVDDLASVSPWTPRGIEIRGTAEAIVGGGGTGLNPGFSGELIRITPTRIRSWGVEAPAFSAPANTRDV